MERIVRAYLPVTSLLTEVYTLRASNGPAQLQLVIIPGNPGNAGYYQQFMQRLDLAFAGTVDCIAVSHLGHDPSSQYGRKVWNLEEQIAHKADFLKQHVLVPGRPPCVVMGHSIGAYMALHALQQVEAHPPLPAAHPPPPQQQQPGGAGSSSSGGGGGAALHAAAAAVPPDSVTSNAPPGAGAAAGGDAPSVVKFISLFPFFSADFTCRRQRLLRVAADMWSYLGAVAATLGRMPRPMQTATIKLFAPNMEPHAMETTQGLLNWSTARNAFHMAKHEFRDLQKPGDWKLLQVLGPRAAVICAPHDMWFPRHHYEEMLAEVAGVEEYWDEQCTHAFVVSTAQCDRVARRVADMLSRGGLWQGVLGAEPTTAPDGRPSAPGAPGSTPTSPTVAHSRL